MAIDINSLFGKSGVGTFGAADALGAGLAPATGGLSLLIPALSSLIGGGLSAYGSSQAADQQEKLTAAQLAEQKRQFDLENLLANKTLRQQGANQNRAFGMQAIDQMTQRYQDAAKNARTMQFRNGLYNLLTNGQQPAPVAAGV